MPKPKQFKTQEEYREWYRKYREKNREKLREYNRIYNTKWRKEKGYERKRVRSIVYRAIQNKILERGNCQVCGENGAEGHHFDYSKPLEVIWLCPVHHKDMHRKEK